MKIFSNIEPGTVYEGVREILPDLRISSENWKQIEPDGTVTEKVKPPEATLYTFKVLARGYGRIDLTVNNESTSYDVGEFRKINVRPRPLTVEREFFCYDREEHDVVHSYEGQYVASYYDTCIPVENRGYQAEVKKGTEILSASGTVAP